MKHSFLSYPVYNENINFYLILAVIQYRDGKYEWKVLNKVGGFGGYYDCTLSLVE